MGQIICVGGASSSGTTLVADLLDSIPGVACPPELYIFHEPGPYRWDDSFVASVLARRERPNPSPHGGPHPWFNSKHLPQCGFDEGALDAMVRQAGSLEGFLERFTASFSGFRGRAIDVLAEKTPINVNLAATWCDRFPQGLFIHVVRHPWSVIGSLERRGYTSLQAAMIWVVQVEAGLAAANRANSIQLRYEDLLEAPFESMQRIAARVGIRCTPGEIEDRFRTNAYRASLGRAAGWTVPVFDGTVRREANPPTEPQALGSILGILGARSLTGAAEAGGTLLATAERAGYGRLDCPAVDPAAAERCYAAQYSLMVSARRRAMLVKPVDPYLDRRGWPAAAGLVRTPAEHQREGLRVLQGVLGQAGQPSCLATALRRRGITAASCTLAAHTFGYPSDLQLSLDRAHVRTLRPALQRLARDWDVIHFHGSSFASPAAAGALLLELAMLRLMGVQVVWHCRGTDSRLESEFRRLHPLERLYDPANHRGFGVREEHRRALVEMRDAVCDHVLAVDEELQCYVPAAEIVRRAIDLTRWQYVGPAGGTPGTVVIAHAPSRPIYKGTEALERAVQQLRSEGLPVEYRPMTGLPNEVVRERMAQADIVVDQLMAGWYGVTAVEAMALGKPVVAYIRPDLAAAARAVPLVDASVDTITDRLRDLVRDHARRGQLGEAARGFVEKHHCSDVIAAQLIQIYQRPRRPLESLPWGEIWERLADAMAVPRVRAGAPAAKGKVEKRGGRPVPRALRAIRRLLGG